MLHFLFHLKISAKAHLADRPVAREHYSNCVASSSIPQGDDPTVALQTHINEKIPRTEAPSVEMSFIVLVFNL